MNKVSPIIEELFDSSADSFQNKNLYVAKPNMGGRIDD
jgi:hypothetical protein